VLGTFDNRRSMNKHKHGEDDEMQAGEGFGQTFIVACQAPEPVEPAEAALDDPATRQQHEALFRLGQLDDLQFDAFVTRGLRRILACIALIGKRQLHFLARYQLNLTGKPGYLRTLLLVGWRNVHSQQIAQRIDGHVNLLPRLRL